MDDETENKFPPWDGRQWKYKYDNPLLGVIWLDRPKKEPSDADYLKYQDRTKLSHDKPFESTIQKKVKYRWQADAYQECQFAYHSTPAIRRIEKVIRKQADYQDHESAYQEIYSAYILSNPTFPEAKRIKAAESHLYMWNKDDRHYTPHWRGLSANNIGDTGAVPYYRPWSDSCSSNDVCRNYPACSWKQTNPYPKYYMNNGICFECELDKSLDAVWLIVAYMRFLHEVQAEYPKTFDSDELLSLSLSLNDISPEQDQIAERLGVEQSTISRRFKKIRDILKNIPKISNKMGISRIRALYICEGGRKIASALDIYNESHRQSNLGYPPGGMLKAGKDFDLYPEVFDDDGGFTFDKDKPKLTLTGSSGMNLGIGTWRMNIATCPDCDKIIEVKYYAKAGKCECGARWIKCKNINCERIISGKECWYCQTPTDIETHRKTYGKSAELKAIERTEDKWREYHTKKHEARLKLFRIYGKKYQPAAGRLPEPTAGEIEYLNKDVESCRVIIHRPPIKSRPTTACDYENCKTTFKICRFCPSAHIS